jgi:hypothetical protein
MEIDVCSSIDSKDRRWWTSKHVWEDAMQTRLLAKGQELGKHRLQMLAACIQGRLGKAGACRYCYRKSL